MHMNYDRFIDERLLTSRDALNRLQIKIKIVEIDESARDFSQRFGRRVLVKKVLLTIKHTDTEEVEEKELDVEEIEKRMRKRISQRCGARWTRRYRLVRGCSRAKASCCRPTNS